MAENTTTSPQKSDNPNGYSGIKKGVFIAVGISLVVLFIVIVLLSRVHMFGIFKKKSVTSAQKLKTKETSVHNKLHIAGANPLVAALASSKKIPTVTKSSKVPKLVSKPSVPSSVSSVSNVPGYSTVPAVPSAYQKIKLPTMGSVNYSKKPIAQAGSALASLEKKLATSLKNKNSGKATTPNQKNESFLKTEKAYKPSTSLFSPYVPFGFPTKYYIVPGTIIPCTLVSGINTQLPGQIVAMVDRNVFSQNLRYLLIPKGSKVIGKYSSSVGLTQDRVVMAFTLIIFPNGDELQLPGYEGANDLGYGGVKGVVHNHFWTMAKAASLLTILEFGISEATGQSSNGSSVPTPAQTFGQSLGQNLGSIAQNIFSRYVSLAPTLTVSPGAVFNIVVVKNMVFKGPYNDR